MPKKKYILTVYKIRNKLTKKFRVGGTSKSYTRVGKAWTNKGALISHIKYNVLEYALHPEYGWLNRDEWYKKEGWNGLKFYNHPSRIETAEEIVKRRYDPEDEVIEILVDEDAKAEVNIYPIIDFIKEILGT